MSADKSEPLQQLHKILAELESLARSAAGAAGEGGSGIAEQLHGVLSKARSRIQETEQALEREATRGARAADDYVRDHAWMSIGIAAAVAFFLGAMSTRRD
jgi:ElaB/YqjD/DUF883 family membrane-anchored ribosome-binding protein